MVENRMVLRDGENGFERSMDVLEMICRFPDLISDEEIEGAARYVNPDIRNTVLGLLEMRSTRAFIVQFLRGLFNLLTEARNAHRNGKKVVFIPFTFPPEIIYCFENLFPVCTEIVAGIVVNICANQGEPFWDYAMGMGLPDSLCSANTITAAGFSMGPGLKPDAIVSNSPGSCNPNAKIHAFASDYLGVPQFMLEKPVDETERGRELHHRYMVNLIEELEEFAGERLSESRMRRVMDDTARAFELYNEFWELRKARPCPAPNILHPTLLVLRSQMWGRPEAVEILQKMVDLTRERLDTGAYYAPEERARVYISYIFALFDFYGFFTWMEKNGLSILGDVLGIHFPPEFDTSSRETMIKTMADIAYDYPMIRQMGASSISLRWLEDISYAAKELDADCCIYCGHHACKHTAGSLAFVRREMMKSTGIPTLVMTGDCFDKRHYPIEMMQQDVKQFTDRVSSRRTGGRKRRPRKKSS